MYLCCYNTDWASSYPIVFHLLIVGEEVYRYA